MTRTRWLLAVALWVGACTVTERGVEAPTSRVDDMVRVEGTVSRVDPLPSPDERLRQVAVITLHSSGKPIRVELAPGWYLDEQGLKYTAEQKLYVLGERVEQNGEARLVAREVGQGRLRLRLRDERGRPLWQVVPPDVTSPNPGEGHEQQSDRVDGTEDP
jgi:hypothetical protein